MALSFVAGHHHNNRIRRGVVVVAGTPPPPPQNDCPNNRRNEREEQQPFLIHRRHELRPPRSTATKRQQWLALLPKSTFVLREIVIRGVSNLELMRVSEVFPIELGVQKATKNVPNKMFRQHYLGTLFRCTACSGGDYRR